MAYWKIYHYRINYERKIGIERKGKETQYFLSIIADDNEELWILTYDNGVWKNNGKELIHYPIKDEEKDVLLFSIFKDNQGILWLETHNSGVYKFNAKSFEKFEL